MTHRAAFRLGCAPVLLLGWNMAAGDRLAFLGPALAVFLLAPSPARPPLKMLAGAVVLVVGVSWVMSRLFVALADNPTAVCIALFAVGAAAFARLAQRPGDMVATLTLISASIVVVIRQWAAGLGLAVPWVMGVAVTQAVAVTLIAHALLPSPARTPLQPTRPQPGGADALGAFGRSAGLVAALGLSLSLSGNSAVLVALTTVSILAAPAEAAARSQGFALLLANAVAAAMVLPLVTVAALRPGPLILLLMALAGGLLMARDLDGDRTGRLVARAGMPVYVVLLGSVLPEAGVTALPLLVDRLLTLGLVMLYALAVVALLRARPARAGQLA